MLKYSSICFYHWKQLFNHVTAEKARKAKSFLQLTLPTMSRLMKREAFTKLVLNEKAVKLERVRKRTPKRIREKADPKAVLPS